MYIRTENHIYLIRKDISYGENRIYKIYNHDFSIIGNDFKVADTIEELCDLVRFRTKDSVIHYIDLHKNTIEDIVVHFGGKNIIIDSFRYCIETDKGLIYVAKMNDKGELELI